MWQDISISIISIVLSLALIPQIIQGFKIKKRVITFSTGLMTFVLLYILAFIFSTLGLYFSTIIQIVTATLWLILFIQSVIYR